MQIHLKKTLNRGLQPVDDEDREIYKKFKIGHVFYTDVKKTRNYLFHKKMFSLVGLVSNNNDRFPDRRKLLEAIQLDIHNTDMIKTPSGKIHEKAKSISFASMDELEFSELFNEVVNYMLKNLGVLLPGLSKDDFNIAVNDILSYT